MKLRFGHVSNSSSSSFIIALNKVPEFSPEVVEEYPILKYIGHMIKDIFQDHIIDTVEEFDAYIIEHYGWGDCNTVEKILEDEMFYCETYNSVIEHMQQGFKIFVRDVDWNEEAGVHDLLSHIHDDENIITIQGEN